MDDEKAAAGLLGDANGPLDRRVLAGRRLAPGMEDRRRPALGDQPGDAGLGEIIVLGVDQEHPPGLSQADENASQVRRLGHDPFVPVGHVALEGGHALPDELGNFVQGPVVGPGDDGMDAPVDEGRSGLLPLLVQRLPQGPAGPLVGEIDDRGRAAEGGGPGPLLVIVHADRAHELVVEVDVRVDAAGEKPQAAGVHDPVGPGAGQVARGDDGFAPDEKVPPGQARGLDGLPAADEEGRRGHAGRLCSAWVRSAFKSSKSSMPTE